MCPVEVKNVFLAFLQRKNFHLPCTVGLLHITCMHKIKQSGPLLPYSGEFVLLFKMSLENNRNGSGMGFVSVQFNKCVRITLFLL